MDNPVPSPRRYLMSELRVTELHTPTAGRRADGGIQIDANDNVSIDGLNLPQAGPLSNRNLIINGAMQVQQRGTAGDQTGATAGDFGRVDRFRASTNDRTYNLNGTAGDNIVRDTGCRNAIRIVDTDTTAVGADDFLRLMYRMEGQDLQSLRKGTTEAREVTLSFMARSSVIGNYVVELNDSDNTRHNCRLFEIQTANTWETFSFTFQADETGTLDDDNALSLTIHWHLVAGSDLSSGTLATDWAATDQTNRCAGITTDFGTTANASMEITAVQLEVGSAATPFEHRSYGDELARCQRYFLQLTGQANGYRVAQGNWASTTIWETMVTAPVPMRTLPASFEQGPGAGDNDNWGVTVNGGVNDANNKISSWAATAGERDGKILRLSITHTSGGTVSASGQLRAKVNNAFIRFNAEL